MIRSLKIKNFNTDDIIAIIYAFIIFLACKPYFIWGFAKFIPKLYIIPIGISLLYLRKFKKSDLLIIPLFTFYFVYLFGKTGMTGMLLGSIFILTVFVREDKILLFLRWFKKILVVSLALSIPIYILAVLFSVPIGYHNIPPLNELKLWDYKQYPFLVVENQLGFDFRFCGMFDEPGVVGSIVTVLLFVERYNLKKIQNIILFLGGIFSFSFFFIVCSFLYMLYVSSNKVRFISLLIVLCLFLSTKNNDIIYYMVWDRFTIEDGKIKGDNRSTENLDDIYKQFLRSDDVFWGRGVDYASRHELDLSCTYKLIVLNYGMVFFIVVCLAFLFNAYFVIKQLKYLILYSFLFLGMMYQRPGLVYDIPLFFLMFSSIYALNIPTSSTYSNSKEDINPERCLT